MVDLYEVNFFGGTIGGAPLLDASLERAQSSVLKLARGLPLEGLKDRFGLEAGRLL